MSQGLAGRRLVVVGASAGIGRALAVRAVADGAAVVLMARRHDRLQAAVAEAGGGTALAVDVRDDAAGAEAMERASEVLGGVVDALCYCAGTAPLAMLADTDSAAWEHVLGTNVVGANQAIRAALPHLAPAGVVVALSSETTSQPRPGLGAYGASKAALAASLASWRAEHPGRRFCCVAVGATAPTEFGDGFDVPLLGTLLEDWARRGLAQEQMMHTDDVAGMLAAVVAALLDRPLVGVDDLVLRSPSAVVGTADSIAQSFAELAGRERTGRAGG